VARTRGVAVDFVLELADVAPRVATIPDLELRSVLSVFANAAAAIAHDHHLDEIEPWDESGGVDSEGGERD